MGRKKRKGSEIKPFCYYCNREFGDEKVLKQHQKVRHFKCLYCSRKLSTVSGLIVHMLQVHKETLSRIPNAIPGRDIPDIVINGMKGVPAELLAEKKKEQTIEKDIKRDNKDYNPHGNKMLSLMNAVAKDFVKKNRDIRVPGMYGGPEFVFGAMLPFPNQKPIPGVMVQREIDGLGNGTEGLEIVMFFKDSDISPEEMYASKLFNYEIVEKRLPINISINKKE